MFDAEAAFGTTTTLPPNHAASLSGPTLTKAEDRLKGDFYWNHKAKVGNSYMWKIFMGVIFVDVLSLLIVQVRLWLVFCRWYCSSWAFIAGKGGRGYLGGSFEFRNKQCTLGTDWEST